MITFLLFVVIGPKITDTSATMKQKKTYKCRYSGCNYFVETRKGRLLHESKHFVNTIPEVVTQEDNDTFDCSSNSQDADIRNDSCNNQITDIQKKRTERLLNLAIELEVQHGIPTVAIDKILKTFVDDQKYISKELQDDMILRSLPNTSILLNDKKRNEEIAEMFFDTHPLEAKYAGQKIYYLSLSGLLQSLFKKKSNVEWIDTTSQRQSDQEQYHDLCDGSVIRTSKFFNTYKDAIQLILYMDECFLIDRTEFMMIYCTLGNFPVFTRCQLHNILPLAAIPTSLIKQSGYGSYRTFRGEVVVGLFDHKAAHELGGFYASFNNMKRFCRHCFLHREDMRSKNRDLFVKRTPEVHDMIINAIETGSFVEGIKKLYGVKGYSILSEIPNFHVCEKLPPDLMHTEFEGELKRELCFFIDYGIHKKQWFSLEEFNSVLALWRKELGLKKFVPDYISDKFYKNTSSNELNSDQVLI